jgi:hypothetical protein
MTHGIVDSIKQGAARAGVNSVMNHHHGGGGNIVNDVVHGAKNGALYHGSGNHGMVGRVVHQGVINKVTGNHSNMTGNLERQLVHKVVPHSHHGGTTGMIQNQVSANVENKVINKVRNVVHNM